MLMGVAVSFFVGIAALRLLLIVIARGQLHWFAYYCFAVGTLTILWQCLR